MDSVNHHADSLSSPPRHKICPGYYLSLFAELDPHMQICTAQTFLFVAQRGQCVQRDLELSLGFTNASASRNISYWTKFKKFGVAGQGFLERFEDPRDRRQSIVRLSPSGREFYDKLISTPWLARDPAP